jgi:hypothetical protein
MNNNLNIFKKHGDFMKVATILTLILLNFSAFASDDCLLHPELLDSEGKTIDTRTYSTFRTNSSLKNCFRDAGLIIGKNTYQNIQITLKHSSIDKKIIIRVEDK